MKSLIKKVKEVQATCCTPQADQKVAQCCAKVSKTVAGCHDLPSVEAKPRYH